LTTSARHRNASGTHAARVNAAIEAHLARAEAEALFDAAA